MKKNSELPLGWPKCYSTQNHKLKPAANHLDNHSIALETQITTKNTNQVTAKSLKNKFKKVITVKLKKKGQQIRFLYNILQGCEANLISKTHPGDQNINSITSTPIKKKQ